MYDDENDASQDVEATPAENVPVEDYSTKGQTTVATRRGYAFVPSDKEIPVVTHEGIKVTKEQAEALIEESEGLVHIVEEEGK